MKIFKKKNRIAGVLVILICLLPHIKNIKEFSQFMTAEIIYAKISDSEMKHV